MRVKQILENRTKWMPSKDYDVAKPRVSVLLPTFRRAKSGLFESAVRSVLNQTFQELELIIVDDCSTDGTFDIIQDFMQLDARVSCIRHTQNIGLPAISEFEAYQKSRGTYIAFIFDDNEWESDAIEQLVEYARQNNIKALAGQYMLFQGKPGSSYDDASNWSVLGGKHISVSNLMITNCFGNGSVLLHRETIETVGFLDPNVALSRLWDWDLWQRIAKVFRFEMVDIMVGREKGVGLEDSLGNTHQLYQWAAQERMHQPRNQELLPENYLECDIFDFYLKGSPFLYRSNCWIAEQYAEKTWFDSEDLSLIAISKKSTNSWRGKRIAYLTANPQVNASSSLNWGRLPYSEDYVLFYSCVYYFDYYNWVLADAIVIERDVSASVYQILRWSKIMGIPCYYYIDDNFIALGRDYAKTYLRDSMKSLAKGTTTDYLSHFQGVFCSTAALRDYFIDNRLHEKITLMEPVFEYGYVQPYHELSEPINIVFFGSYIRGEVLINTVYPALVRIAQKHSLHLYCPEETCLSLIENMCDEDVALEEKIRKRLKDGFTEEICVHEHLTIHSFPRTLSLELAMQRLADKKIQIQIHCGPVIENNRYKTVNALLNAVCLGAVLIATSDFPYSSIESNELTCILSENTVDAWEIAINKGLNKHLHRQLYQNAFAYCQKNFDSHLGEERLISGLDEVHAYDIIDLNKRLLGYCQYLNNVIGGISTSPNGNGAMTTSQEILPTSLYLCSLTKRQLVRTLQSVLPNWSLGGRGVMQLLPLSLSKPLLKGEYIDSRLPKTKRISLVLVATECSSVLFEFVSNDLIIRQSIVNIHGIELVTLAVPEIPTSIRLRVANHNQNGNLYVLQRRFFSKQVLDIAIQQEGCVTNE